MRLRKSAARLADQKSMFPVYALNLSNNLDTEAQCATLDEALRHLRELITNEMADPSGVHFDRHGLCFESSNDQSPAARTCKRRR